MNIFLMDKPEAKGQYKEQAQVDCKSKKGK